MEMLGVFTGIIMTEALAFGLWIGYLLAKNDD